MVPYLNERVVAMMHSMGYFPGRELGDSKFGTAEPIEPYILGSNRVGLGLKEENCRSFVIAPSNNSLNGFFVKEGEDFPFYGFQEPWVNAKDRGSKG